MSCGESNRHIRRNSRRFQVISIYDIEVWRTSRVHSGSVQLAALVSSPAMFSLFAKRSPQKARRKKKPSLKSTCTCKCSAVQAVRIENAPHTGFKRMQNICFFPRCFNKVPSWAPSWVPVLNRRQEGRRGLN